MTPEIALQTAVRARLVATPGIVALVPAVSILDRNERPNPRPSIIMGEAQAVDEGDTIARTRVRIFMDLHMWIEEPSTAGVKVVAGAIRTALRTKLNAGIPGIQIVDARVERTRFVRDPDGKTSHGIATINAIVEEK